MTRISSAGRSLIKKAQEEVKKHGVEGAYIKQVYEEGPSVKLNWRGINVTLTETHFKIFQDFMVKCAKGDLEYVEECFQEGSVLSPPNFYLTDCPFWYRYRYPINCATFSGNSKLVKQLLERGAYPVKSALENAISVNDPESIKLVIKHGVNIHSGLNEGQPIQYAAKLGHLNCVETLLNLGAEISPKNGCPPLYYALKKHNEKLVDLLIKRGAKITSITEYLK